MRIKSISVYAKLFSGCDGIMFLHNFGEVALVRDEGATSEKMRRKPEKVGKFAGGSVNKPCDETFCPAGNFAGNPAIADKYHY